MESVIDALCMFLDLYGARYWKKDDRDDVLFIQCRGKNLPEIFVVLQFSGTPDTTGSVYMFCPVAEGLDQRMHERAMLLCNELAPGNFWVTFFLDPEAGTLYAKSNALLTLANIVAQFGFALGNLVGVVDENYPLFQRLLLSEPEGAAEETEGGE